MIVHRRQRERQIIRQIESGITMIPAMVRIMYKAIDPRLHGAAGRSVLAHLLDMRERGLVREDEERWLCA